MNSASTFVPIAHAGRRLRKSSLQIIERIKRGTLNGYQDNETQRWFVDGDQVEALARVLDGDYGTGQLNRYGHLRRSERGDL